MESKRENLVYDSHVYRLELFSKTIPIRASNKARNERNDEIFRATFHKHLLSRLAS